MLLRIFLIAFLIFPSYASWYTKSRVSCESDYEKETPSQVPTKFPKVEGQGYRNIILIIFFGVASAISLLYSFKSRCCRVMFKLEKEVPKEEQTLTIENEKLIPKEFVTTSPLEIVPQPIVDSLPQQEVLTEESYFQCDDIKDCILDNVIQQSHRATSEISIPDEKVLKISEMSTENQPSEEIPSCSSKSMEIKQSPKETTVQGKTATIIDSRKHPLVVGKSKTPGVNISPTKGSSGTKLPQKTSKNSLIAPKPVGRTVESAPNVAKQKVLSTESILKKQGRKESNDSIKKNDLATEVPSKCKPSPSVEKVLKENETLKKRITVIEKAKRDAIRDSDIIQKSMVSLKSAVKVATEENAKLKKQLEIAKRDKTEAVRRITARWREKLGQLEERMRMDAEEASTKAESITSNVASNSSKIKPDPVTPKSTMTDTSRLFRWKSDLKLKIQDGGGEEPRENNDSYNGEESASCGINEINCECVRPHVTGETDTSREATLAEVTGDTDMIKKCSESNQIEDEMFADEPVSSPGVDGNPTVAIDPYLGEDEWQEDDIEHAATNEENDATLQEIISEAAARLDIFRATEMLDDQEADFYQGSGITSNQAGETEDEILGKVAEQNLDAQKINAESALISEEITTTHSPRDLENTTTPPSSVFTSIEITSEETEVSTSLTEINQKEGRSCRVRDRKRDSNTSTETFGRKVHPEEGRWIKTEGTLTASVSKSSVGKDGLTPRTSERKICTNKPPVPKSTANRSTNKNESGFFSKAANKDCGQLKMMERSIEGGSLAHGTSADQNPSPSKFSRPVSFTKIPTSTLPHNQADNESRSDETAPDESNQTMGSDTKTEDEDKKNSEDPSAIEPVTEIFHSNTSYWTGFEEENRCNVVDQTNNDRDTNASTMDKSAGQGSGGGQEEEHFSKYGPKSGVKEEAEELAAEIANMQKAEDQSQASEFNINANISCHSVSDMELEARHYIQDLINLSSSFSEEEKKEVEEILGQCLDACGHIQIPSSIPGSESRSQNANRGASTASISGRMTGRMSSSNASADTLITGLQRATAGSSNSNESATNLGRGSLTEKLKQCFVYDPEKLQDQSNLKNFMNNMEPKKSDSKKGSS